jgi:hypothetical protein
MKLHDPRSPACRADRRQPLSALSRWFTVSHQFNRKRPGNRAEPALFATIDRYVLREVATALAGVTVVLLAILVSYQLARILGVAAERGFPHDIVLALIGLTTLENLIVLVPISMLLATMLALGRLYHESEMAAVRACGCIRWRCRLRPCSPGSPSWSVPMRATAPRSCAAAAFATPSSAS